MRYVSFIILITTIIGAQENDLNIYNPNDSLKEEKISTPLIVRMAMKTIYFYQNYLGKIKGSYCPMYPSCSNYGSEAIKKYNFKGILITFDRLHRCSHDLKQYPRIVINETIKYYDPPILYDEINNN